MFNSRKSQAALEFLMTYGWAILVVLIVISALAYFGVLNPQRLLPSRCTLPTGFSCKNYVAVANGTDINIKLNVVNGMGSSITLTNFTLGSTADTIPTCDNTSSLGTLTNGKEVIYNFKCVGTTAFESSDQKYRWEVIMKYHAADSSAEFTKTVQGELLTTLE